MGAGAVDCRYIGAVIGAVNMWTYGAVTDSAGAGALNHRDAVALIFQS